MSVKKGLPRWGVVWGGVEQEREDNPERLRGSWGQISCWRQGRSGSWSNSAMSDLCLYCLCYRLLRWWVPLIAVQADPYLSKILAINLEDTERDKMKLKLLRERERELESEWKTGESLEFVPGEKRSEKINVCWNVVHLNFVHMQLGRVQRILTPRIFSYFSIPMKD